MPAGPCGDGHPLSSAKRSDDSGSTSAISPCSPGILTRYFDFFGEFLAGGTALAATGVLLLFILYVLEKARRRTLAGRSRMKRLIVLALFQIVVMLGWARKTST